MHLVEESFYTLHLRKWEAARIWIELNALLDAAGEQSTSFPALNSLLGGMSFVADEEAPGLVTELEITPADTEEES